MKLFIRDITGLTGPGKKSARFSVTIAEDDGTPVFTENGWTIDSSRIVKGPRIRTAKGFFYKISAFSPEWEEKLENAVVAMKSIQKILGPEPVLGPEFVERYEEEGEVV